MKMIFESKRLLLVLNNKRLAKKSLDFYIRNKEFLKPFEPIREPEFYTLKEQKQLIRFQKKEMKEMRYLSFVLFKKEDREKIIGYVNFSNIVLGSFLSAYVGYKVDKDYTNNGYITEALDKLVEIMFNEIGLHRIEANIMPRNKASIRVVEKCGFSYEGESKKYLEINGKWEDHIHMVRLNEEE